MIGVLEWSDPPPPPPRRCGDERRPWPLIVWQLKHERPGKWGKVTAGVAGASKLVAQIRSGKTTHFAPAGSFDAQSHIVDGVVCVWARYLGENGEYAGDENGPAAAPSESR